MTEEIGVKASSPWAINKQIGNAARRWLVVSGIAMVVVEN